MSEAGSGMSRLELMLRASAAEADWPPTPDLAAALVPRLEGVTPRHTGDSRADAAGRAPRRIRLRRPLAVAIAALLLLAATAAAIPGVRDPVLDWLGLRSVRVERVPAPLPQARGARLALGDRTTLALARRRLGFAPVLPTGLGEPAVWHDSFPPGGQLGLVYPRGIVITELQGDAAPYIGKFLPPGTRMERLTVAGGRALWIHGALHQYAYADRTGRIRTDSVRTAGDVLLWRRGDLLIRIEGARSRAEALAIARSARAAP